MRNQYASIFSMFVVVLAGLIAPAIAQVSNDMRQMPNHDGNGVMSGDMMRGGMSRGMMPAGCMGTMRSMNGRDGPPNSQWQRPAPPMPN